VRLVSILVAAIVLCAAVVSAQAATPAFRYGVAAGEITSTSAVLWTRAPAAGPVQLAVHASGGTGPARLFKASASQARDLTVRAAVRGLNPATTYIYGFFQGKKTSAAGTLSKTGIPPMRGALSSKPCTAGFELSRAVR